MNNIVRIAGPISLAAILLAFAMPAIPAQAQTKDAPAAAAPVAADPQNTSATYGDWVVRCSRASDAPAAPRICEAAQSIQVQGQQGLIAQIAIGRLSAKDSLRITVALPSNISFPSVVRTSLDEKDTQPLDLGWRRCLPGGCFADAEVKDDQLKRWKSQTGSGRLQFKDATGRDVVLPFSFRGLAQAMDGLAKTTP